MSDWPYSDNELNRYFSDPESRKANRRTSSTRSPRTPLGRFWLKRIGHPQKAQAATFLSVIVALATLSVFGVGGFLISLVDELPPPSEIENPEFQLATIAYTADGQELARYARQNRSWVTYSEISPHVINALVATEDHRFFAHWGIDMYRTLAIPYHVLRGRPQGGSTITQQLARNLYNKRIGYEITVSRKLKEMITAVQLERRYTKPEIIEMYLNTIEFGYNAFGIEASSKTFFGKDPIDLDELEGATLVGMLKAITYYNPIRNPENARRRRNIVLSQMMKRGFLPSDYLEEHREDSVKTSFKSSDITKSLAPYFAERVRNWLNAWARDSEYDLYEDGLVVYTTLDARLQSMAEAAVDSLMPCLQAVADYEWTRPDSLVYSQEPCDHLKLVFEPFKYFWESRTDILDKIITETPRFRRLGSDVDPVVMIAQFKENESFMDSLKTIKTRLQSGLVAMDPQTGYIKAWVGGRELADDWYDHVGTARRQPGSTFKPFVYTAAIDNGWSPYYTLPDDSVSIMDAMGNIWRPVNTEEMTGRMMTLREGLAYSKNTITAQLMNEVGAERVAFYARRMGIQSPLLAVPSLALGTSNVTLLEMTTAYSTLANGGLLYQPTFVTRIEDRFGNVLYESRPEPGEALSEATAYTMIDMLRAVIEKGTAIRLKNRYPRLRGYDLAGKTGTTQFSTDNWFMIMHPDLVVGSWVGFNDARFSLKTLYWGQGAHTAMYLVGNFLSRATAEEETFLSKESRFPMPSLFGAILDRDPNPPADSVLARGNRRRRGRVAW